jgi:hypothetical protein
MQFGIFDQNDRGPYQPAEQYENRLRLIEFYDSAGFRTYHMSEHHSTPLSLTPSPSVFLAAVAQRTRRIRLGPQHDRRSRRKLFRRAVLVRRPVTRGGAAVRKHIRARGASAPTGTRRRVRFDF